jgi:hypothetical protein
VAVVQAQSVVMVQLALAVMVEQELPHQSQDLL